MSRTGQQIKVAKSLAQRKNKCWWRFNKKGGQIGFENSGKNSRRCWSKVHPKLTKGQIIRVFKNPKSLQKVQNLIPRDKKVSKTFSESQDEFKGIWRRQELEKK